MEIELRSTLIHLKMGSHFCFEFKKSDIKTTWQEGVRWCGVVLARGAEMSWEVLHSPC